MNGDSKLNSLPQIKQRITQYGLQVSENESTDGTWSQKNRYKWIARPLPPGSRAPSLLYGESALGWFLSQSDKKTDAGTEGTRDEYLAKGRKLMSRMCQHAENRSPPSPRLDEIVDSAMPKLADPIKRRFAEMEIVREYGRAIVRCQDGNRWPQVDVSLRVSGDFDKDKRKDWVKAMAHGIAIETRRQGIEFSTTVLVKQQERYLRDPIEMGVELSHRLSTDGSDLEYHPQGSEPSTLLYFSSLCHHTQTHYEDIDKLKKSLPKDSRNSSDLAEIESSADLLGMFGDENAPLRIWNPRRLDPGASAMQTKEPRNPSEKDAAPEKLPKATDQNRTCCTIL